MPFYDSHIHLADKEYNYYLDDLVKSMKLMNIYAFCMSVDLETSIKSMKISHSNKHIYNFVGIHPEFAQTKQIENFINLIENKIETIDGIGEIGLDYKYVQDNEEYNQQRIVFGKMLELAEKYNKPISIHSRKSLTDVLEIINSYDIKRAVLHWFDGNKKQLNIAMDMNLYVSYGPILLYSKDKKNLVKNSDKSKILVETDGPVRYANCFNYIPSSSTSCIVSVINCMSETLDIKFNDITNLLSNNSRMFIMQK
ncbi:MAG: TatD family hydrolase [Nitrososphaeraceae archaeon]